MKCNVCKCKYGTATTSGILNEYEINNADSFYFSCVNMYKITTEINFGRNTFILNALCFIHVQWNKCPTLCRTFFSLDVHAPSNMTWILPKNGFAWLMKVKIASPRIKIFHCVVKWVHLYDVFFLYFSIFLWCENQINMILTKCFLKGFISIRNKHFKRKFVDVKIAA